MKYSVCSTWKKDRKIEDIILFAAELGLEGIEIWDGHIDEFTARNGCGAEKLKQLLDEKGLKCVAIAPYFTFLESDKAEESLQCAAKCVNYAKTLGCSIIRTFAGYRPSRDLSDKEWSFALGYLSKVAALGEENGIIFALETHNNHLTDTYQSVLKILDSVGSSNLRVIFDGYNYLPDGLDVMEAYDALEPYTVHYHIKNYSIKGEVRTPVQLDKGDVDFAPLIARLKQKNYKGFISFEYFCDGLDEIINASIDWIKSV